MKNKMIVPKLRFSGFESSWEINRFVNSFNFLQTNTFSRSQMNSTDGTIRNIHYGDILTIYNYTLSDVSVVPYLNVDVNVEKFREESYIQNGDIIIADTAEDLSAGKVIEVSNVTGNILAGLHTLLCRPKKISAKNYWGYYLNSNAYRKTLTPMITGTKVYSISKYNISKTLVCRPKEKEEQQKIADCLTSLDDLVNAENKKLELLKEHKKGLMQKLFPAEGEIMPEWRFPEFRESEEWKLKEFSELLDYERPDKYIVKSTKYINKGIPVLTANKGFILGYTAEDSGLYTDIPVIIFDDFTVDNKYVDFTFKVKSSAIKILKTKSENNLKFIYELMQTIKFNANEHKRYYISAYQKIKIFIPNNAKEQQKIADCLSSVDDLISEQRKKIEQLKEHKRGLTQGLFPSIEEVQ